MRQGKVKSISFEQEFGRGKALEPVTVKTGQGDVLIEGKIDRVDVLRDGRVKIIDYKTGAEKFDLNEVRKGFRLQLMLYLQAAQGVESSTGWCLLLFDSRTVCQRGKLFPRRTGGQGGTGGKTRMQNGWSDGR